MLGGMALPYGNKYVSRKKVSEFEFAFFSYISHQGSNITFTFRIQEMQKNLKIASSRI
jgi:hypothetical protein